MDRQLIALMKPYDPDIIQLAKSGIAMSLTFMVGATEEAFARVKPLFELLGKNISLVANVGAGQT